LAIKNLKEKHFGRHRESSLAHDRRNNPRIAQ
jgi:hypothetical protein